jgi:hypothetical protein
MNHSTYKEIVKEKHRVASIEYKFVISSVNIGENASPVFSLSIGGDTSPMNCGFIDAYITHDLDLLKRLMAAAIDLERSVPGSMVKNVRKLFKHLMLGKIA